MAGLLQRLEQGRTSASAAQYRAVAHQVSDLLAKADPDEHLQALLNNAPATAELYENLRYEMAGLCRAPLESALKAELATAAAIAQAMKAR
jgi:hypothetical protein